MQKTLLSPLQPSWVDLNPQASKAALLVIDMQPPYFQDSSLGNQEERLTGACNQLIELFENHSLPVFYTRTVHSSAKETWTLNMRNDEEGFAFAGGDETTFVPGLHVSRSKARIINKTRDSAFVATDFEMQLATERVSTLVVCGVSTHSCVGLTAADAYARNFQVILATDAIASHKPQYHTIILDMLEEEYHQPRWNNQQIEAFLESREAKNTNAKEEI